MSGKTCIIISGPTAVGKTSFAIRLAQQFRTEIISADSRQCFRELHIGVAKPSPAQLQQVAHHFISSHSIHDEVTAKTFEAYALKKVQEIFEKSDTAVMVGGTGLYIKAFERGLDEIPDVSEDIKGLVNAQYARQGMEWLRKELEIQDPLFFLQGEMQNPHRMMRALAVKYATGRSILDFHTGSRQQRAFKIEKKMLTLPRSQLYKNIDHRVDEMMREGLLKEAENLFPFRHLKALQTVGYKELFDFMENRTTLEQAVEHIKRNTRHYAKRQLTWLNKYFNGEEVAP